MRQNIFWTVLLLLLCGGVSAQTYTETGDAGQTLATAQVVPGGITQINGTLGVANDVDLYKLTFNSTTSITFYADNNGSSGIDDNLILFDSAGHGIWGDDDGGGGSSGLASQIVWTVSPGTYYLAYGDNNIEGMTATNVQFCGNDDDNCTADTSSILDHFSASGSSTGNYAITISSPTSASAPTSVGPIPTLSEWGMIILSTLLALGAVFTLRRQRH